jgi:hypothetical protein
MIKLARMPLYLLASFTAIMPFIAANTSTLLQIIACPFSIANHGRCKYFGKYPIATRADSTNCGQYGMFNIPSSMA